MACARATPNRGCVQLVWVPVPARMRACGLAGVLGVRCRSPSWHVRNEFVVRSWTELSEVPFRGGGPSVPLPVRPRLLALGRRRLARASAWRARHAPRSPSGLWCSVARCRWPLPFPLAPALLSGLCSALSLSVSPLAPGRRARGPSSQALSFRSNFNHESTCVVCGGARTGAAEIT